MHKTLLIPFVSVLLAGCALGPDYIRPAADTPQTWRYEVKEAKDVANRWWEQFGDPVLNEMILSALKENKDLRIAAARVDEYEGRLMVSRADLFPKADASYKASKNRISEHSSSGISSLIANPYHQYQAGFGASWGTRHLGDATAGPTRPPAQTSWPPKKPGRGMILSLCSSVAVGYVNLRDLDNQLIIARRTAENTKGTLDLFQSRAKGGVISDLELSQVKSQYALTLTRIPAIEKLISQQEDALSILLGRNPGAIVRGKTIAELMLPMVPQGLPSDLLERRPDIRQAEQGLIAANARIGEARALYYPNISLTGAFGWSSSHLSDLLTSPARVWNWGGAIGAPIFAGGAIRGQNKAAEAVQQETLFAYQKTVQNAFREVNDSLMRSGYPGAARRPEDAGGCASDYARIARLRFDNGYTSYIEVLDAESSLFEAESSYSQTQGTLFSDLVGRTQRPWADG